MTTSANHDHPPATETVTGAPGPPMKGPQSGKEPNRKRLITPQRLVLHTFLVTISAAWLLPIGWALFTSFRPFEETSRKGYLSWPEQLTLSNYTAAMDQGQLGTYFVNTMIIVLPALALTLLLAAMAAFVLTRIKFRGNLFLLLVFTAGNLLPPQVIIMPLASAFSQIPIPRFLDSSGTLINSYWGVGLVHVGFQVGFCVFVLSNFLRLVPSELFEAAQVDGANLWQQFWHIALPLSRPPLAALATLQFTWMYNDFFWALILMVTGNRRPITSALDNLQGSFFADNNLIAAATILIAIPTVVVYVLLQRHFVRGLTVGATKG